MSMMPSSHGSNHEEHHSKRSKESRLQSNPHPENVRKGRQEQDVEEAHHCQRYKEYCRACSKGSRTPAWAR
eukprot:5855638-Prorocentrum_lima.AAC.1